MALILCALSGEEFKVQHFPRIFNDSRESYHPIFDLSTSELIAQYENYLEGKFTPTENYLYYLALFNSTKMLDFRCAAVRTDHSASIIATNIHSLTQMAQRIDQYGIRHSTEVLSLPRFVITFETRDLKSSGDWLKVWQSNYTDYCSGYKSRTKEQQLGALEYSLDALIKNKTKELSSYSATLANWAEIAFEFPTYLVLDENDNTLPMSEYWKRIIRFCTKGERIYAIPDVDLTDLIEHCEEFECHGTIQAATLMTLLRSARERKQDYLSTGDVDISSAFKILDPTASVEQANMLTLILNAPKTEPIESQYPSKLAYVRAKLNYQQACIYYAAHPTEQRE